ncbi:hypothetical protein M0811_12517 [Anaeramoeba ignava]|uniref:Uncharacterized protein n=1 Tax=Anaeramoeba ignava TaxID=1746090 RepID=A0A9Q0L880_ANAIG|nr:hypothetical protein M0811_12517 [Anaeramoeba ignava]
MKSFFELLEKIILNQKIENEEEFKNISKSFYKELPKDEYLKLTFKKNINQLLSNFLKCQEISIKMKKNKTKTFDQIIKEIIQTSQKEKQFIISNLPKENKIWCWYSFPKIGIEKLISLFNQNQNQIEKENPISHFYFENYEKFEIISKFPSFFQYSKAILNSNQRFKKKSKIKDLLKENQENFEEFCQVWNYEQLQKEIKKNKMISTEKFIKEIPNFELELELERIFEKCIEIYNNLISKISTQLLINPKDFITQQIDLESKKRIDFPNILQLTTKTTEEFIIKNLIEETQSLHLLEDYLESQFISIQVHKLELSEIRTPPIPDIRKEILEKIKEFSIIDFIIKPENQQKKQKENPIYKELFQLNQIRLFQGVRENIDKCLSFKKIKISQLVHLFQEIVKELNHPSRVLPEEYQEQLSYQEKQN